jgi:hypothetical protein
MSETQPTTHGIRGHRILTAQEDADLHREAEHYVAQHPLTTEDIARLFDVPIDMLRRPT